MACEFDEGNRQAPCSSACRISIVNDAQSISFSFSLFLSNPCLQSYPQMSAMRSACAVACLLSLSLATQELRLSPGSVQPFYRLESTRPSLHLVCWNVSVEQTAAAAQPPLEELRIIFECATSGNDATAAGNTTWLSHGLDQGPVTFSCKHHTAFQLSLHIPPSRTDLLSAHAIA